ncbi:hypothetical protein KM043_001349 [Ampulex compressa]|nr:hypothetical protein KM043_001349 [Ampulex compressa]
MKKLPAPWRKRLPRGGIRSSIGGNNRNILPLTDIYLVSFSPNIGVPSRKYVHTSRGAENSFGQRVNSSLQGAARRSVCTEANLLQLIRGFLRSTDRAGANVRAYIPGYRDHSGGLGRGSRLAAVA